MNVFEDLIIELKQENLLEQTVVDEMRHEQGYNSHPHETEVPNQDTELRLNLVAPNVPAPDIALDDKVEVERYDTHLHDTDEPAAKEAVAHEPLVLETEAPQVKKPRNGQEFYRKRATGEVSNLQMVEHVLTGVEREYMKIVPRSFEDFKAKMALNAFLHVTDNENSVQHQEAEFALMTETERWCTALSERDRDIPVSSLRHYCENSKPPLSSQAIVALARYYRNLPYSHSVRSKFDFVITRLFSRPSEGKFRVPLFGRDETLAHINTLYREWSSIALYGANDDDSDVLLTALSFEDLAIEAENASSFDQLIVKDFFGRLRAFKESISETFFAPSVLAAAIDANVRIGNAYVSLIARERQKTDAESIQSKYGDAHDESISEGTARALDLVDLLRTPLVVEPPVEEVSDDLPVETVGAPASVPDQEKPKVDKVRSPFFGNLVEKALSVNRWLLAASFFLIAASFGLYIYSNFFITDSVATTGVRAVQLEDASYAEYITTAKVSGETLYGMLSPSWETLPKEKRQELLQKIYQAGKDKGYTQVNLIRKDGKVGAFASATRLDITTD